MVRELHKESLNQYIGRIWKFKFFCSAFLKNWWAASSNEIISRVRNLLFDRIVGHFFKGLVTLKRVAPSDVIWNKFHVSHWQTEKKEGRSFNGSHETYFKWHLMVPHVSMQPSSKSSTLAMHWHLQFFYHQSQSLISVLKWWEGWR